MSELEVRKLSKTEAWELTDEIRQGFESIHESKMVQVDRLARAYEGNAWEEMGYDNFEEYKQEEFGEELQHQRLELEERIGAVKVLADSGMAKAQIADILGVHRNTVTNLMKRIDAQDEPDAQRCASTQVDAAGQSVEEVRHIDEDTVSSPFVPDDEPPVVKMSQVFQDNNQEPYSAPTSIDDRFAGIDFDGMILPVPSPQIIETAPSPDTSDYFVPRTAAPSWSPPQITELSPPPAKAYDGALDDSPEFLEPPMKLQKVGEDKKIPEDKHCKTCACYLLP